MSRRAVVKLALTATAATMSTFLDDEPPGLHHTDDLPSRLCVDPAALAAVDTATPRVALTFDDGPDPDYTPAVLAVLARFGARATFFVVGRNARTHPELVRAALVDGHELANHTQDHLWLDAVGARDVQRQIAAGTASLGAAGAPAPAYFRPPHGWTSTTVARAVASAGLRTVFWTDCLEAHLRGGARVAATAVAAGVRPGSILLLHDGGRVTGPNPQRLDRSRTVEALPWLLARLGGRGLTAVSVRELMPSQGGTREPLAPGGQ